MIPKRKKKRGLFWSHNQAKTDYDGKFIVEMNLKTFIFVCLLTANPIL